MSLSSDASRWPEHPAALQAENRPPLRAARCARCHRLAYFYSRPGRRTACWEEEPAPAQAGRYTGTGAGVAASGTGRGLLGTGGGPETGAAARPDAVALGIGSGTGGAMADGAPAARAGVPGSGTSGTPAAAGGTAARTRAGPGLRLRATGWEPAGGSAARSAADRLCSPGTPRRGGRLPSEPLPSLAVSSAVQVVPAGGRVGLARCGSRCHCPCRCHISSLLQAASSVVTRRDTRCFLMSSQRTNEARLNLNVEGFRRSAD